MKIMTGVMMTMIQADVKINDKRNCKRQGQKALSKNGKWVKFTYKRYLVVEILKSLLMPSSLR